jgi:DNA adenine methylase
MLSPARPDGDEELDVGESAPAPFLKWAGGKRQILAELLKETPDGIDTYYEPFVGGGALFFALASAGRFRRAVLADCNPDLIDCYLAIKTDVDAVITALRRLPIDRDQYYEIRAIDPATLDLAARAARTIYLNKVGFNGLYRVNSRGQFNVPYGKYNNPTICNERRLRADARVLRDVTLECRDFSESVAPAGPGDFVYFDPPYVPLSSTASFTAYAKSPFGPVEQARLAAVLRALGQRQVPALLSNSFCPTTRALYRGLRPRSVQVRRSINSVGDKRGPVKELLVKSFSF